MSIQISISNAIKGFAGKSVPDLLLDAYPNAEVAYSLRKLSNSYAGNSIRVRRSSDNTEQDIGFVNNELDIVSLLAFCGAGNGFVTTWYDQSGKSNNATQSTALNQSQIVSSGVLIVDSVTGYVTTTWTGDRYNLTNGIDPNTRYLSVSVNRRLSNSSNIIHIGTSTVIGGTAGQQTLFWFASSGDIRTDMFTGFVHGVNTTSNKFIITSEKNSSNLKTVYLNGSAQANTSTEAPSAGSNMNIFGQAGNGNFTSGQYQEYIYWNSDQSANRTSIETEINNFWVIY